MGGLGLGNPSLEARREYALSVKVTKPLVEQIVSQSHQLPEDSLTKLAQQEVRSEKSKELERRVERKGDGTKKDSASFRSGDRKGIIIMTYSASPPGFGL